MRMDAPASARKRALRFSHIQIVNTPPFAADDVAELLIPFIRSAGGESDARAIESAYFEASLGPDRRGRFLGARWVESRG